MPSYSLGDILNANKVVFDSNVTGGTPQLVMETPIIGIYLTIDHLTGLKKIYVVSVSEVSVLSGDGDAVLLLQNDSLYVANPNSGTRRMQVFLL